MRCLEHLHAQIQPVALPGFCISVYLLDDGSTDDTADEVSRAWPNTHIIRGDGSLYWCGGMRRAWTKARESNPDYFLLLNDDTILMPHALQVLLSIVPRPDFPTIAVSSIADPDTGNVAFGGRRGRDAVLICPHGLPVDCDTMNANCVLISKAVVRRIGIFHASYTHSMGDFDYGFTARRAGFRVVASGEFLGFSTPNPETNTWRDKSLPRRERLRLLWFTPKGLPFTEWATYAYRNLGWTWPYRALSPALRIIAGY
jgi:GT2 family glycosyltransferase